MATLDQIAKKELDKQNRRDAEFGYLSGSGKSSDQPDENLATAQEEVFKEWIVTPSLDRVVETGFDYNAAINKINKDYADLQERVDAPGPFLMTKFEPGDFQLQQKKNQEITKAKLAYAESKVGAPVNNHNKMGFWISTLLQRYKTPEGKANAFEYFYPDGDMMEVPIVGTDGKKKVITVYKRNQEEDYGLLYPMGRDVNEFGVVGAELASARTITASLAWALDPTKHPAIAAGVGDYLGIKIDKLINWGLGKALGFEGGEGEFSKIDKLSDLKLLDFLPFKMEPGKGLIEGFEWDEDMFGAFLTTTFTKGIGITAGLISGQNHPAMKPMYNEIMKLADELGLPPVVIAQMASNPLIAKTYFRAGDITGATFQKSFPQRAELFSRLKAYGVGIKNADEVAAIEKTINLQYKNGDFGTKGSIEAIGAKNKALQKALKEASEGNSITWQDWADVVQAKTEKLAEMMKPFKTVGKDGKSYLVTPKEGYVGLKEAFKEWDDALTVGINKTRSAAVNNSKGVSYTIGGNNSLKGLINELETGTGAFQGSGAANVGGVGTVTVFDDALGKAVPVKVAVDLTKKSNKPLLELINDVKALDDVILNPKTNTPNLGAVKGQPSQWDAFSQIENLRSRAFKLMSNEDPAVRDAGRKLHQKIVNIMDDNSGKFKNGGSDKYNKAMAVHLKNLNEYEKIVGLNDMQMAISNKMTPETFAERFFHPNSGFDLNLLKQALNGEKNVNWMAFEKSFKASLLRDPNNIKQTLTKWQAQDPDGLSALLKPKEIDELMKIGETAEIMNNSVIMKAFNNQSSNTVANTDEIITHLVEEATKKRIGAALNIENFIKNSGGLDGKVMTNVRSGIIEDILNRSSVLDDTTGSLIIKPRLLEQNLKLLNENNHMKMFFSKQNLDTLDKFWLYTNVLGASSDVGGKLAAAELGGEMVRSMFQPSKIIPTLKTLLAYNITSRILGRDITPKMLESLFKPGLNNSVGFKTIRSMMGSIMSEFMEGDYEQQREIGVGVDVPDAVIYGDRNYLENHPMNKESMFRETTDKLNMLREVEDIQENSPRFDQQSSLANPNLGFRSVGAGSANPNTYAQGVELFGNNPREITFASQGGIMNTRTAFQRVA